MKIAVIGCGAIGGLLAAKLVKIKNDSLFLVDANQNHLKVVNSQGLQISGVREHVNVPMYLIPKLTETVDVVLLCVKSYSTDAVMKAIKDYLHQKTLVVSLQNGLGNCEMIAAHVGFENTVGAVIGWGATNVSPGHVAYTSKEGRLELGYLNGQAPDDRLMKLSEVLSQCEPTFVTRNIEGYMWSKCIINSTINSLGAVFQKKLGEMIVEPQILKLFFKMVDESVQIAEKKGVKLEKVNGLDLHWLQINSRSSILKKMIAKLLLKMAAKKHGQIKSSLWQDLEKGNKTEKDFLNGAFIKAAQKMAISSNTHSLTYEMIQRLENHEPVPVHSIFEQFHKVSVS